MTEKSGPVRSSAFRRLTRGGELCPGPGLQVTAGVLSAMTEIAAADRTA